MSAIDIVTLGEVDEEAMQVVETALWQSFGFQTRRLPALPEPTYALDRQRQQHSSALILRDLVERLSADAIRLLAVTERDLFIPMLSFVFGQAQVDGRVAVVSLARLRQEFHGLPGNHLLLLSRAVKEGVHEVGHTFGLTHCVNPSCPMSLSNTIRQVDQKGEELCRNCLIALEESIRKLRVGEAIRHRSTSHG